MPSISARRLRPQVGKAPGGESPITNSFPSCTWERSSLGRALPAIMPNSMVSISVTSEISPAELLGRIQARFRELGCFGSTLPLTITGRTIWRAVMTGSSRCTAWWTNATCLPAARLARLPGHHEAVVDETSPPHLPEDEFASGLSLQGWIELIETSLTSP